MELEKNTTTNESTQYNCGLDWNVIVSNEDDGKSNSDNIWCCCCVDTKNWNSFYVLNLAYLQHKAILDHQLLIELCPVVVYWTCEL